MAAKLRGLGLPDLTAILRNRHRKMGRIAPGPPGLPLIGHLREFRGDVLGTLIANRAQYGDVVRYRLGPHVVHLLAHPADIDDVLLTRHDNYDKETRSSSKIRSVTGPGLLTSSGETWLRQRRLTQPVFARERMAAFLPIMVRATAAMLDRWSSFAETGQPLDVASEMMRLTCTIIAEALFGADVTADLPVIEESATVLMAHAWRRLQSIADLGTALPTPGNLRFRRALRKLEEVVQRIIRQRRDDRKGSDLLAALLARQDDSAAGGLSDTELRNETITLLLAGHETTANALTWTFYLLAQHPQVQRNVQDEAAAMPAGRALEAGDLGRLERTSRVFREALRLYPPIWIMERRARKADVIRGFEIPAGSSVIVVPYVTHRHPEFWTGAERFDPDRFLPGPDWDRAAPAYLPFGVGQRLCIGSHFATTEALVILAMTLGRYGVTLAPGPSVTPLPGITLRTREGLMMRIHQRRATPPTPP